MSKRTNHWYLFDIAFRGPGKAVLQQRLRYVFVWMAVVAGLIAAVQTGVLRPDENPLLVQGVMFVVVAFVIGVPIWRARRRAARVPAEYLAALRAPEPAQLVDVVQRSLAAADALPDIDAYRAQSKALALAFYGREAEANHTLAAVAWGNKAPLIQATGLSAEAVVTLLCRHDAGGSLALARRAQDLASLSPKLPGAAASARYHATIVGASEALAGSPSAATRATLDGLSKQDHYPPLRLLSLFGLAAAAERDGDAARATDLRRVLSELAPHCAPLQLTLSSFTADGAASAGVVSAAIATGDQSVAARAKSRFAPTKVLVLWVVVLAAFLAIWRFLDAGSP